MNTTKQQQLQHCPLCHFSSFPPTEQKLNIAEILASWENGLGINFPQLVWRQYTESESLEVTLHRCGRCNFAMFQPPLTGSNEFYEYVTANEYYVSDKWEFYQAIKDIKRYKSRRVLDIGCGSGHFLDLLRDNTSVESAGYDFNPEVAGQARTKGHTAYDGNFPQAVLTSNEGKPFDAVCAFQVLEHVSDPVAFVKDIQEAMSPGGILIVGVPDAAGPVRHFADALTDIPPHHVSRWCESAFTKGLTRHGLNVLKVAYEPLPDYLWDIYLPVMLEEDLLPNSIGKSFNKWRITHLIIKLLRRFHVRWLHGVPGHTLYILLQARMR